MNDDLENEMEFVEPNVANSDGQRSDYRYELNLFRCDSESTPFYTAKNTQKDDKSSVYQSNVNFDDQRNFNEQEIEDFFGVDYQEMQRIVQVSQKYLNNVKLIMDEEKAIPSPVKIDVSDAQELDQINYLDQKAYEVEDYLIEKQTFTDRH